MWLWEAVNHGDSALLNVDAIGGLCESIWPIESTVLTSWYIDDWTDNARDILNFLLSYLPDDPTDRTLPTHLSRVPESLAASRKQSGFQSRTLVPIGHSFGGCSRYCTHSLDPYTAADMCCQAFAQQLNAPSCSRPWSLSTPSYHPGVRAQISFSNASSV